MGFSEAKALQIYTVAPTFRAGHSFLFFSTFTKRHFYKNPGVVGNPPYNNLYEGKERRKTYPQGLATPLYDASLCEPGQSGALLAMQ